MFLWHFRFSDQTGLTEWMYRQRQMLWWRDRKRTWCLSRRGLPVPQGGRSHDIWSLLECTVGIHAHLADSLPKACSSKVVSYLNDVTLALTDEKCFTNVDCKILEKLLENRNKCVELQGSIESDLVIRIIVCWALFCIVFHLCLVKDRSSWMWSRVVS